MRKLSEAFYPFVDADLPTTKSPASNINPDSLTVDTIRYAARIAVYDDPTITPRVVLVEPKDVRDYLAELTETVTKLAKEQGGLIPFMIIREIVENYIHAYFIAPTISILDGGNTIRFSDQGPGISEKERALEYGTTSATEDMKRYIRGVGSGLPLAQQYMLDKGGSLTIQDNISGGVIVTISTRPESSVSIPLSPISPDNQEEYSKPITKTPQVDISERGQIVMSYLATHEEVGPTDLLREFGASQPTWSRELQHLEDLGLLIKRGQKRHLTEIGRSYTHQTD